MSDEAKQGKKKKPSGSEKRERGPRISFRVNDAERAEIKGYADAEGVSIGGYVRNAAMRKPKTRANRRPLLSDILLAQLKGEAGKVDSNLAQLLKLANLGKPVPVAELTEAAKAVKDCWLHIAAMLKGSA